MKRLFIMGYYGKSNLGDDALLLNFLLEYKSKEVQFIIPSFSPKTTENLYKDFNIEVVPFQNTSKVLKSIIFSNGIAFPGGGYRFDNKKLYFLMIIISLIIKFFNKQTIVFPIGIEPIKTYMGKITANLFVSAIKKILVRDLYSKNELTKIGINENLINYTIDPAINLSKHMKFIMNKEPIQKNKMRIAVNFLNANQSRVYENKFGLYTQIVDYLLRNGYEVNLIPMSYGEGDQVLLKDIKSRYLGNDQVKMFDEIYSPIEMIKKISEFDACVGMRLHFKVFSALNGIPFASITRSKKSKAICEYFEQIEIGDITDSFADMEKNLNEFLNNILDYEKKCKLNLDKALSINEQTSLILGGN